MSPVDVVRSVSMDGHEDFVLSVLPPNVAERMVLSDPFYRDIINRNIRLVQDYVFAVDDWDKLPDQKKKKTTKPMWGAGVAGGGGGLEAAMRIEPQEIVEFDDPEEDDDE